MFVSDCKKSSIHPTFSVNAIIRKLEIYLHYIPNTSNFKFHTQYKNILLKHFGNSEVTWSNNNDVISAWQAWLLLKIYLWNKAGKLWKTSTQPVASFWCFCFIFEHISYLVLVFLLITLNMQLPAGQSHVILKLVSCVTAAQGLQIFRTLSSIYDEAFLQK